MPGVSGPIPVSGAYGVGKVRLRFKPYKKKKFLLGLTVNVLFLFLILFCFCWSRVSIRREYVLPLLRKGLGITERIVHWYQSQILVHGSNSRIAIDQTELNRQSVSISSRDAISYDANGTVIITTCNRYDALFYQGYSHIIDRLLAMDIHRRTALGTLSELLGNSSVAADKISRTMNFAGRAEIDLNTLSTVDLDDLQAYSDGINSYLEEITIRGNSGSNRGSSSGMKLPLEYYSMLGNASFSYVIEPWKPLHSLAIWRLLGYQWSHGWEEQLLFGVANSTTAAQIHFQLKTGTISKRIPKSVGNYLQLPSLGGIGIAVSGKRSVNGKAILATQLYNNVSHRYVLIIDTKACCTLLQ